MFGVIIFFNCFSEKLLHLFYFSSRFKDFVQDLC